MLTQTGVSVLSLKLSKSQNSAASDVVLPPNTGLFLANHDKVGIFALLPFITSPNMLLSSSKSVNK